MSATLTETQWKVLSAASQRDDHCARSRRSRSEQTWDRYFGRPALTLVAANPRIAMLPASIKCLPAHRSRETFGQTLGTAHLFAGPG